MNGIRIVSDGTATGSQVLNADGTPIPYVQSATVVLSADKPPKAFLVVENVAVDVAVDDYTKATRDLS